MTTAMSRQNQFIVVFYTGKAKVVHSSKPNKEFIHYFPSTHRCSAISRKARAPSHKTVT